MIRFVLRPFAFVGYYASLLCRSSFQQGWRAGVWLETKLLRRT